jgi:hypothetical protein
MRFGNKNKKQENGLYDFSQYKDNVAFQVIDFLSKQKMQFSADELIIATDQKPYWREKIWPGYKHGRKTNDKSGIDWKGVSKLQSELVNILKDTSFIVIDVQGAEGDDCAFVLSEYISNKGEIIIHSLDHDWIQCLSYNNVSFWETKHSAKTKECGYCIKSPEEIETLRLEHWLAGDAGDYVKHIDSYTQFSDKFKEIYPNKTELEVYPKRFEIDMSFTKKYGESAYKHPRFGYKSFMKKIAKSGQSIDEFIDENPIRRMNAELNKVLVLMENVPEDIKQQIIESYESQKDKTRNIAVLNEYFLKSNNFELTGKIGLL